MPFSLLDLEKNVTCDGMNFTHLTWLMLLLYLVKVETPKMHVNINLSLNVNYEMASKCTKLHWQFHKMFYKWTVISQHAFKVSVTSTHTWSQMVALLNNRSINNVLFRVKPSLHQAFLQVIDVTNLCFKHALLHNTPNFIIYRSFLMKLYDTFDAMFFGNISL